MKSNKYSAFTLMELIIVIVIIGTLLGASISLLSAKESAKMAGTRDGIINLIKICNNIVESKGGVNYSIIGTTNTHYQTAINTFTGISKNLINSYGQEYTLTYNNPNLTISTNVMTTKNCDNLNKWFSKNGYTSSCVATTLNIIINDE